MPEFDPAQLTDAVLESFSRAPDPRTRDVLRHLIRHLHAFVRDAELTFDEWRRASDCLTRTANRPGPTARRRPRAGTGCRTTSR